MIPYLGCEHARDLLQGFLDGELPVDEQVAMESHLRWCRTCALHLEDLRVIGDSIRLGGATGQSESDEHELAGLHAGVLSRVHAEYEQSFAVQVRGLFDDLHLLWAGLGAVSAVLLCLFGTMGVLHAAEERPDSLAGVLHSLANPGSNRNPVRLDRSISAPRAMDEHDAPPLQMRDDDAVFALAAVVTREGRIANYELLFSERDGARRRDRAAQAGDVSALFDVVERSRFAPAQRWNGAPVAVNVVWLLARTTVKGSAGELVVQPPRNLAPPRETPVVVPPVKPVIEGTDEVQPISRRSPLDQAQIV